MSFGKVAARAVVVASSIIAVSLSASAQPLVRDLSKYCIFAQRHLSIKDMKVDSACNLGVNCAKPNQNSQCGTLSTDAVITVQDSQLVADRIAFSKPGAIVWQVFTNNPITTANVTVNDPPVQTFTTPIIAGTCDNACHPTPDALNAFCQLPDPFPSCDPSKPIVASPGSDCSAFDAVPGNNQCDLAPGTYGDISVHDNAKVVMATGDYNVCNYNVGKNAMVMGQQVAIYIPGKGTFNVSNESTFGQDCGSFKVRIQGAGDVSFGRNAVVAADVCAPLGSISLGHSNTLTGPFIGLDVSADRNDHVKSCGCQNTCVQ